MGYSLHSVETSIGRCVCTLMYSCVYGVVVFNKRAESIARQKSKKADLVTLKSIQDKHGDKSQFLITTIS